MTRNPLRALASTFAAIGAAGTLVCSSSDIDLGAQPTRSPTTEALPDPNTFRADENAADLIVVDDARVYWTTSSAGYTESAPPARVRSCLKDDCDGSVVTYAERPFDGGTFLSPFTSIAARAGDVYWVEALSTEISSIHTCPREGCAGPPRVVVTDLAGLVEIAVDETHVYFTSLDDSAVMRCPLEGCTTPEVLAVFEPALMGIALQGDYVYWNSGNRIRRCRKDGSDEPVTLHALARNMVVTPERIVFQTWAGPNLQHCPIDGCVGEPTLIASESGPILGLGADAERAYWLAQSPVPEAVGSAQLRAASVRTTPSTVIPLHPPQATVHGSDGSNRRVTVDDVFVYWTVPGPRDAHSNLPRAGIYRTPK